MRQAVRHHNTTDTTCVNGAIVHWGEESGLQIGPMIPLGSILYYESIILTKITENNHLIVIQLLLQQVVGITWTLILDPGRQTRDLASLDCTAWIQSRLQAMAWCSHWEIVSSLDLLTQGLDLLTQGLDLLTQGLDLLTQGLDLLSQGLDSRPWLTISRPWLIN
jgi:hypothetical protein